MGRGRAAGSGWIQYCGSDPAQHAYVGAEHVVGRAATTGVDASGGNGGGASESESGGGGGGLGGSVQGLLPSNVGSVASAPIAHDAANALLGEVVLAVQWDSRATSAAAAAQGLGVGNWATLSALPMMVTSDPQANGGDDAGNVMRLARDWAMGDGPRGNA